MVTQPNSSIPKPAQDRRREGRRDGVCNAAGRKELIRDEDDDDEDVVGMVKRKERIRTGGRTARLGHAHGQQASSL